jgi:hypothetical protein
MSGCRPATRPVGLHAARCHADSAPPRIGETCDEHPVGLGTWCTVPLGASRAPGRQVILPAMSQVPGTVGRPISTAVTPMARSGHSDDCSKAASTRRVHFGAPPYPNGSKSSASMMIHAVETVLGIGLAYHPKGTR